MSKQTRRAQAIDVSNGTLKATGRYPTRLKLNQETTRGKPGTSLLEPA